MKLARTIRLDGSDLNVFDSPAEIGEWAISGAFSFSNWTEADLVGKARQAFSNGWLGLDSYGRATVVAVTAIGEAELAALVDRLAAHFVEAYGAPSAETARPVAAEEIDHMRRMCEDHTDNTLLTVGRTLVEAGVREQFRSIPPQDASLAQLAVHGS